MDIEFKTKNDKQILAAEAWLDDVVEQILYGGAKGGGKSFLGASLIFGDALIYPGTHYFIARKELIDLRRFTMPTIREVFQKWGLKMDQTMSNGRPCAVYNGQDHVYKLYNDSEVHLIACPDLPSDPLYERFGSMQMTRGWEEEAGEIPEDAHHNLWLSIGRWKNQEYKLPPKLLITANPKKGWMKRDFVDMQKEGVLPRSRKYIQAFAEDNIAYLGTGYVEKLHADPDKVRRQRLAEGNWEYDDDKDSLITYDALSDTFSNSIVNSGEKYLTVDVGRKRDRTVFAFWEGLELYDLIERPKQGTEKTEQQTKDFAAAEHIPYSHILIDSDGIGGGVADHLLGVQEFNGGSSPVATAHMIRARQEKVRHDLVPKTVYGNLKAQCGWKMAELINEHKVAFKMPEKRDGIIEELTAILRDENPDGDGKKFLRDKKKVKQDLLNKSPDIGDAIMMRAFFELKQESGITEEDPKRAQKVEEQTIRLNRNKRERGSGGRSNK